MKRVLSSLLLLCFVLSLCDSAEILHETEVQDVLFNSVFMKFLAPYFIIPEASLMLEKIQKVPRGDGYISCSMDATNEYFDFEQEEFYAALNSREIESEDEGEGEIKRRDHLYLIVYGDEFRPGNPEIFEFDYNSQLFIAAIRNLDVDRIKYLISKRKHQIIDPDQKTGILEETIKAFNITVMNEIYDILGLLLQNGFYPPTEDFQLSQNLMDTIIDNPVALQIFLDYKKDFFVKQEQASIQRY